MKEKVFKLCKLNIPVILLNNLDSLVVTKYLIILELGNQLIPKFWVLWWTWVLKVDPNGDQKCRAFMFKTDFTALQFKLNFQGKIL